MPVRQFGKYIAVTVFCCEMIFTCSTLGGNILKIYTLNGDSFLIKSIPLLGTENMTPLMGQFFCKTKPLLGTDFSKKHAHNEDSFMQKDTLEWGA